MKKLVMLWEYLNKKGRKIREDFLLLLKNPEFYFFTLLGIAILTRIAYYFAIQGEAWFQNPMVDASNFHQWAQRIIAGEWIGKEIWTQSPLYAYFLALIYLFTGAKPFFPILIQFALGIINIWLLQRLALKITESKVISLLAMAGAVFYSMFFFYEATLLSATLILTINLIMLTALFDAYKKEGLGLWFLSGLMLGLGAAARPNILLFYFWVILGLILRGVFKKTLFTWSYLRMPVFFSLGVLLVLTPMLVRNTAALKEPMLSVSTGGLNFYLGNSNPSKGFLVPFGDLGLSARNFVDDFKQQAEKITGKNLTYAQSSRFWLLQTWREINQNPDRWRQLLLDKLLMFLNRYEITTSLNFEIVQSRVAWLRLPWLHFGWILPLALLGMIFSSERWAQFELLYGLVLAYAATNILLFVSSEYRFSAMPAFLIFAAWGGYQVIELYRRRKMQAFWRSAVLFVFFAFLANVSLLSKDSLAYRQATAHFNFGALMDKLGQYDEAANEFGLAYRALPHHDRVMEAYGESLHKIGRHQESLAILREVYQLVPNDINVLSNLGNALTANGLFEEALLMRKKAIAIHPELAMLHFNLGITYYWYGKYPEGDKFFARAIELDPKYQTEVDEARSNIRHQRQAASRKPNRQSPEQDSNANSQATPPEGPSYQQPMLQPYMYQPQPMQYQPQPMQYLPPAQPVQQQPPPPPPVQYQPIR